MSALTPDSLRALGGHQDDRCEGGIHYGCTCHTPTQRQIYAHADAWEADKRTMRLMAGMLSTFGRYSTMHPEEVLAEFAALAAPPESET